LVSLDDGLEICVEDEVNQDIEGYIQNFMWRQIRDKSRADEARDEIVSKSHGNFQWVVLVVPRVLQMCRRGRYREIKKIIQAIPSDLGELYKSLLEEVTDDDLPRTLKLIQWICFAQEPLSLGELRIATVVDMNTPYRSIRECQEDERYADTDEEMARRVVDLSKGLAEVREHNGKRVAQFNHQSVKDYIIEGGLQILTKLSSGSAAGRAHFQLSRSCIKYINMDEIMTCRVKPTGAFNGGVRLRQMWALEGQFPFLRYAVKSWVPHAQGVERASLSQEDLLSYFHEPSRKLLQHWIDIEESLSGDSEHTGATLLHVASYFNLHSVVEALLNLDNIDANPKNPHGTSPLHYAAEKGHEAIVRLLLKRKDIKVNLRDVNRRTPLSYASWNGHETVVRLLLERAEIEADSKDDRDQTPLHIAAANGHETTVRLLLERSNVDANSKDYYGFTPLDNAARGRHKTVVRMLLEQKDVEADFKDDQDRTPLSHAAGEGDLADTVVELLLKRNNVDVNFKDAKGRTPLSYAASKGDKAETVVGCSTITLRRTPRT